MTHFRQLVPPPRLLKNQLIKCLRRPLQDALLDTLFTYTGFVCSIRCAQSMACKSACRFLFEETVIVSTTFAWGAETNQWLWYKSTKPAVVELIPCPLLRVVSKKMGNYRCPLCCVRQSPRYGLQVRAQWLHSTLAGACSRCCGSHLAQCIGFELESR